MHPDSRLPNEAQRKKLCEMLHHVLVDIRALAAGGHGQQASDLANAFHNLPHEMWCEPYYRKWPQVPARDYRSLLKDVEKLA
jgi:hypothetical protein